MNEASDFEDVIAELPVMLGYIPTRSLIVITLTNRAGRLRELPLDMRPEDAEILAAKICAAADGLLFVAIGLSPLELQRAITPLLRTDFEVPIHAMLFVDALVEGAEFTELGSGQTGRVPDWRITPGALDAAMNGHVIFGSDAEIAALYRPQRPIARRAEGKAPLTAWLGELEQAIRGEVAVDAAKVGWLLSHSPFTRRLVLERIDVSPGAAHDVFAEVGRVTRGRVRVEALTAAAVAAYIGGRRILVDRALDAALKTAELLEADWVPTFTWQVHDAFTAGVEPYEIKRFLFGEPA